HLEEALPESPPATITTIVRNACTCRVAEQQEVACLMLVSMTFEIQKNLEDRIEEDQSISTYMLKMKGYLDQMKHLGYPMPLVLGVNLLLSSLSKDYDQCVQNYNMHGMWKSIPELHAMLKLTEKCMPKKAPTVLAIRQAHIQKPKLQARGKEKNKGKKLNKNKANSSGTSGALDLYVGNGNRAAVEAIGRFDLILPSGMVLMARKPFTHASERANDLLGLIHGDVCGPFRTTSREESATHILNMVLTKKVENTPDEIRSVRIPQAHERYGYYVDAEEHKLEDHGEPTNYRVAFSDPKFDKWLEAINMEMQSMKDNQVWNLVDLPPNYKIVGSKWLFKKKTDMDGNIHTYKARLVAKGFTQTYGVEFFEGWKPLSPLQLAVEEVMSE
ncbi:zinc finger, CCHC-type containing protein, partial [Tanacetum coccineum]